MEIRKDIKQVLQKTEELEFNDTVTFTDSNGNDYSGKIAEIDPNTYDEHKYFLVKGDGATEDCVLEVWFDSNGQQTYAEVLFEEGSSESVTNVSGL